MELFPDKFIPKLHFLIHCQHQSRHFGPLQYHMCMGFERKHQVIKNIRHFNFKNMPYTALKRMILNAVASFYSSTGELNNGVLCELHQVTFKKNVVSCTQVNGIKYCLGASFWFHNVSQFFINVTKEVQVRVDRKLLPRSFSLLHIMC